ncbi:MAG: SDR family NAD(P)-dependent oxidoreductase [Clostridium sp.]
MEIIQGKSILVIGGTGTIGKRLIEELIKYNPKVIRIFSRDEYKQFKMQHELKKYGLDKFRFLIGDVRDYERVERAINGIDIVFNLAAMKHVGSCEYNPDEAIKTNVNGMQNVIKAASKHNIEYVLFASSDKAINPTNTYGATKLLAEKLVQAAEYSKGNIRTKFIAVRFGNVMGSRGSVIPLFKKQILEERRVTITDPKMSRFMMRPSETIKLMLKAIEIGNGGEVFVLKMPVINLLDLTEAIIESMEEKYGIQKSSIRQDIIGTREGEKKYEELMTIEESHMARELNEMYVIFPSMCKKILDEEQYKKCEIKSYKSKEVEALEKKEIAKIIEEEKLI